MSLYDERYRAAAADKTAAGRSDYSMQKGCRRQALSSIWSAWILYLMKGRKMNYDKPDIERSKEV